MDQQQRDRSRRGDRPSRFSDAPTRERSNERKKAEGRRIFVSNLPYEYKWTDLKDLFKDQVGDVTYAEVYKNDEGKSNGNGMVEFSTERAMRKAQEVMQRYEINGRKLIIKNAPGPAHTNSNNMRDNFNRQDRPYREDLDRSGNWGRPETVEVGGDRNTYGLSLQFLDSIGVQPPLVNRVFVANLDYKVDRAKIKEVFKMAGKVRHIDPCVDKDGKSRGFGIVVFDHPVEAVQAISMFDKQFLYERKMTVRMDRGSTDKTDFRLPEGLQSVGLGLGPSGEPLRDVVRNLPSAQPGNQTSASGAGANAPLSSIFGAVPTGAGIHNGMASALASSNMGVAGNAGLANNLGLQALGLSSLGALQNQLLQQGISGDLAGNIASALSGQSGLNLANQDMGQSLSSALSNQNVGGALSGLVGNNVAGIGGVTHAPFERNALMGTGDRNNYGQDERRNLSTAGQRDKVSDMVMVNNLPPSVTWQLLREKFGECGDIKFAEMTGNDSAVVRFHREWDAQQAIKMFDRTRIDGRTIDVRFF